MAEVSGSVWTPLASNAHLLEPVLKRAREAGSTPVAAYRAGDKFVDVTAAALVDRIRAVAKGLLASGVAAGDRVALMSHTRLEWTVCDYAILATGGVTVPIYETSSAEQVRWILSDSEAVMALVETPAMAALYQQAADMAPACREALVIDEGALDALTARGAALPDADLDARIAGITVDQLATIIYTSGTTGRPKGCMLTHGNLRANVLQSIDAIKGTLGEGAEVTLLFLPLAHVLAKIISLVCLEWGAKVCYATDTNHLIEELPMAQPTMVVSVPRVFEKVYNGAEHHAQADGKGSIFAKAANVAIDWSTARAAHKPRPVVGFEHAVFDKLVYGKIRAAFGGHLRFAFSGGGPLGDRLTHFFNGIGVKILEGYGLTETSPTLTANRSEAWKPGTVGRPVAGTTIRIADDGEILAKGPQVFQGYWHNPAASEDTFVDGFFRTGDVGELDAEGYLRITGRLKELIVTAAGKNVAPAPLEDRLRAHPLISQAVVIGDRQPFIAALLALDDEAVATWATEHSQPGKKAADLVGNPELRKTLQLAVDDANSSVSRAESIRSFVVLPHDLTIDNDELTPTLKVKRAIVAKRYAEVIEGIYRT